MKEVKIRFRIASSLMIILMQLIVAFAILVFICYYGYARISNYMMYTDISECILNSNIAGHSYLLNGEQSSKDSFDKMIKDINSLIDNARKKYRREHQVEVLASVVEAFRARQHEREIGQVEDAFQVRHGFRVYVLCNEVAHVEQACLRMVHNIVYLLCVELMEYGHCHCTVGQRGKEGHCPVCGVASTDGNLVALGYASAFEGDVYFFNFSGHIVKL